MTALPSVAAELVVDARSGDWLPLNLDWGG